MTLRMGVESRNAADAIRSQGMSLPDKPEEGIPDLPADLTSLDDVELMGLYSQITAWSDYIAVQRAFADTDERRLKRKVEFHEATALVDARVYTDKITDARLAIKADPGMSGIHDKLAEAESYKRLVDALYANSERDAALISRELSRRTARGDQGRRDKWTP